MAALTEINAVAGNGSPMKFTSFDLVKLIDAAITDSSKKYKIFFNTFETDVKITFSVKDRLFTSGIKEHIADAFRNIIGNSIKITNGSGKISIKLEKFESFALLSVYSKSYIKKTNPQFEDILSSVDTANNLDKARDLITFYGGAIKNVNTPDGANILIITIPAYLKTERIKATRTHNYIKGAQVIVAIPDSLLKDSIIEALEAKKAIVSRCVSSKEFNAMVSSQLFTVVVAHDSFLKGSRDKNIISAIKNTILLAITDNPEYYADMAKLCFSIPVNIEFLISKLNKLFADINISSKKQRRMKKN